MDLPGEYAPAFDSCRGAWDAWARLWDLPVAAHWSAEDVDSVARLCLLVATFVAEVPADDRLLGRAQGLEDRLGLNPKARRQLGWESEGDDFDSLVDSLRAEVGDSASS